MTGLLQYIYKPAHLGLSAWPEGELVLDFAVTDDPRLADIFVVPGNLNLFADTQSLYRLPYYRGHEHRHVFMGLSESTTTYGTPSLYLRPNLTVDMLITDPNSIAIPWPVEDHGELAPPPSGGFTTDVSFHGWVRTKNAPSQVRRVATESCRDNPNLVCDIMTYSQFYGHLPKEHQLIRRRLYRESLRHARFALCPESIPGNIPYRFYEAMSAARVPMLISTGYVLPFESLMPRSAFYISVASAKHTGSWCESWKRSWDDNDFIEHGERLQRFWREWLDPTQWTKSFTAIVEMKLLELRDKEKVQVHHA